MNSYDGLYHTNMNKDRYSPEIVQGEIKFHGQQDIIAISCQKANASPYYEIPEGTTTIPSFQCTDKSICFQTIPLYQIDPGQPFNAFHPERFNENAIKVLTSVHGLGEKGDKDGIYSLIRPFGLIDNSNEFNETDRFNIQKGGSQTVTNRSTNRINAGDIVMADLPPKEYNEYEKGKKELIFKTFKPTLFKMTPHNMRKCLEKEDDKEFSGYHSKFHNLVDQQIEIKLKQILIYLHFVDKIQKVPKLKNFQDNTFSSIIDGKFNLKEFKKNTEYYDIFKTFFFPVYDPNIKGLDTDNNKNKRINNIISDTPEQEYITKAEFLHFLMSWIMGQATTSANPGQNFNMIMTNFAL